jgi:small subunit ribosomal protein S7
MELKNKQNLYISIYIKKFINNLFKNGKKVKIEIIFFKALFYIKHQFKLDALYICLFVLDEIKPILELKSLRLGSMVYKIPVPLLKEKQLFKAIKIFVKYLRSIKRQGSIFLKFLEEIRLILQKQSEILKQNQQVYKLASNNRAFAHFR